MATKPSIDLSTATTRSEEPLLCGACRAFGSVDVGRPCPSCGGSGGLSRLVIPIRVVSIEDLVPSQRPPAFRRLAVLRADHHRDTVSICGVSDAGHGVEASIPASRFAEVGYFEFVERGKIWSR